MRLEARPAEESTNKMLALISMSHHRLPEPQTSHSKLDTDGRESPVQCAPSSTQCAFPIIMHLSFLHSDASIISLRASVTQKAPRPLMAQE